jgi:hypothetical protein
LSSSRLGRHLPHGPGDPSSSVCNLITNNSSTKLYLHSAYRSSYEKLEPSSSPCSCRLNRLPCISHRGSLPAGSGQWFAILGEVLKDRRGPSTCQSSVLASCDLGIIGKPALFMSSARHICVMVHRYVDFRVWREDQGAGWLEYSSYTFNEAQGKSLREVKIESLVTFAKSLCLIAR